MRKGERGSLVRVFHCCSALLRYSISDFSVENLSFSKVGDAFLFMVIFAIIYSVGIRVQNPPNFFRSAAGERSLKKSAERSEAVERLSQKKLERSGAVERKFSKIMIFFAIFLVIFRENLLKRALDAHILLPHPKQDVKASF